MYSLGIQLFIVFPYTTLYFCEFSSYDSSFMYDVYNLTFLDFVNFSNDFLLSNSFIGIHHFYFLPSAYFRFHLFLFF